MECAIERLKKAELYETCNELYKLIIPIHEKNRDYKKLSECHKDLKEIFDTIILANQNESRFFGSYYRVSFFGHKFEELHGREYIYKEPKLTRLGEITDRLVVCSVSHSHHSLSLSRSLFLSAVNSLIILPRISSFLTKCCVCVCRKCMRRSSETRLK
jgi:hypothetical protein